LDGGLTWRFVPVADLEKSDFRSLYAFDSLHAVVASTGSPAVILRTDDGGQHWSTVYRNDDTTIFFDGIDFWNNKEGMIYGDPIKGRMLLMSTHDGGRSWKILPATKRPLLVKGEASFAASGTGIRCAKGNELIIVTGGKAGSRVFRTDDHGNTWESVGAPFAEGKSSAGVFSVAYRDDTAILVGGDYTKEELTEKNIGILVHRDLRFSWLYVLQYPRGYKECVEFVGKHTLITVGPTGFDITKDIGMHWHPLNNETGYHVVRKSRSSNLVIAAGGKGKIAVLATRIK